MRKECKANPTAPQLATIQGYHEGSYSGNYAFQGFHSRRYFTSDRWLPLDENFNRPDGKPLKGYGLEIETECSGIRNAQVLAEVYESIIFPNFPEGLFKMQRDGSLGGDTSAECITQVMTKGALRNMYPAFKVMFNTYWPAFRISATASGNCGMHVNISNGNFGANETTQAVAIRKMLYIINRHYELMCPLFNRNPSHTHYAAQMYTYTDKDACKAADLYHMSASHGNCFNGSHFPEGRIEIRLVGGQKDFGCFRNTMECVFHLVEAVKKLSWQDLDDVVKLFSGCNQYVYNRLSTKVYQAGHITDDQLAAIRATIQREELL